MGCTLPETNSQFAPENGWDWNMMNFHLGHKILSYEFSFWGAFRPIFRCELLVLGSVIGG